MSKIRNYLGRNLSSESKKDTMTKNDRSALMSKVRSSKTKLEVMFFQSLRLSGVDFEEHPTGIIGRPDLLIRNENICIFIDSNFWHGWQYPRWKHKMKNDFWRNKIENNRIRDRRVTSLLRRRGYTVLRFWEHQIKNNEELCVLKVLNAAK